MASWKLITRADDFGASPGTNDAILDALRAGFIRNAGVMAPGPYLRHRLEELVDLQEQVCLGLHAVVNSEWETVRWGPILPVAQIPGLVEPDGTFHRSPGTTNEKATAEEIVAEIEAQLSALRELGIRPRYLDCHMVFTWIEGVAPRLAELCAREDLVFGNGPGFKQGSPGRNAELRETATPDQRCVIIYHPAYRDNVSESFGTEVATARADEARFVTDSIRFTPWLRQHDVVPETYA
ncbi:MAG: ChbG/HpnK family deacetylase [Opitutales bacterium]